MPHHETVTLTGTICDVFAHRFVVQTSKGRILADVTPRGAETIALRLGARVTLTGQMKPSELKVERYAEDGGRATTIDHKDPPDHHAADADPAAAIRGAEAKGYMLIGHPRRKPKHFELIGQTQDGTLHELHMEFDGHLRKVKPIEASDPKWANLAGFPART